MRLQDFDFRLYVFSTKDYVRDKDKYQILADLKTKSEFMERNALKEPQVELELFTGFYDKKGRKLYENDIVVITGLKNFFQIKGVLHFDGIAFCIKENNDGTSFYLHAFNPKDCKFEVIGNIHENPELLGVRNENKRLFCTI